MLAGALCRILKEDGYKTAPFKSQNMALNSYITKEGLEMGRAQVMQAEAAGIEPSADMNPILLKPTNDTGSQIIVRGRPFGMMSASEYYKRKKEFIPSIMESYRKLDETYDVIVIEGAGSPAEINLKKDDIVNMGFAKMADAPVLLVGDIDRGGVFAQLAGTMLLLEEEEKKRVKGTIINKFRGDVSILKPGLRMLEEKINTSVLGVIPYFHLDIEDEDSLTERFRKKSRSGLAKIAVIRLPRISNFTDIAPLEAVDELDVSYVSNISQFGDPDVVIIPGSKNTISDLLWMRQNGLEGKILRHAAKGGIVFGICGGYQMLGQSISDPTGAEQKGTVRGMGLLPVTTVFEQEKRRTRVSGRFAKVGGALAEMSGVCYEGYEIHALRYLLKPPQADHVQAVLFECLKQSQKNQRRLTVSVGKKIHEIPYRNMLYIMSVGNNIEIHFQDSHLNLSARHTFSKTVAPLLTDERFLTCARGIVVNLSHVKDIRKDGFLMDNGEFVPISRRLYPSVKNTYIDFQFEHILS